MLHVRETLFHDRQHFEISCSDLPGQTLATRVVLGAIALTLDVKGLLLVEAADDFLQTGFHIAGNIPGLLEIFDDRCREQPYRRSVGVGASGSCQCQAKKQHGEPDGV